MKVGIVYQLHRDRNPKMRLWVPEGFRALGCAVVLCDSPAKLAGVDAACDVLVFEQKGAGIPIGTLRELAPKRHAFWCSWNFDLTCVDRTKPLAGQLTMQTHGSAGIVPTPWLAAMRLMDLAFVKEASRIEEYAALGVTAEWLDQGCTENMPEAILVDNPRYDVLVIGSKHRAWKRRQHDALLLARRGYRVAWVGPSDGDALPECIHSFDALPPLQLPGAISEAACVLGVDFASDEPGYWSDRHWLVCGAGGLLLRPSAPLLPPGPYVTYDNAESLIAQLDALLRQPQLRRVTAAAARKWVFGAHLYQHRCLQLLRAVDKRRSGIKGKV